jgi:hypothetical protein
VLRSHVQGGISNPIGRVIEEISIHFFISEDFLKKVHVVPAGSFEEKFFRRCTLDGCLILIISDEIQEPKPRDQKAREHPPLFTTTALWEGGEATYLVLVYSSSSSHDRKNSECFDVGWE